MFSKEIAGKITKQNYTKAPVIEGVRFRELKQFVDDGGSFLELGRLNKGLHALMPDYEVKQINYSQLLPGTVKATHIHKNQDDVWFVPPHDRLLVGLKDIREGSKTENVVMRFVMGASQSRLLFIPRGVAHGVANVGQTPATLIYLVNQQFSPEPDTSDEYRLDPYFFGENFWEMTAG